MSRSNMTIDAIDALEPADIASLSIGVLAQLDADLDRAEDSLKRRRAALKAGLLRKYGAVQVGTKTTRDGAYSIKVTAAKRVEWDQSALAALWKSIGETAGEYIRVKYEVSENAYKSWPEVIRKEFEPARTVKPGATTVTIVKKEAA